MTARVAIIGAGGHARVIADILRGMESEDPGSLELAGFVAPCSEDWPGLPLLGEDSDLPELVRSGAISHFVLGVGCVEGGNTLRRRLVRRGEDAGARAFSAIHPSSIIASDVEIAPGAVVMALVAVNCGARIGAHAILNTGSRIDHDCKVAELAHIAPGAVLSGSVSVGENTLIGVGACVRQGVRIGENVTVGAGSVVVNDVADGAIVRGCPARDYQS
jgi:UDP-perosamine 4-acetyltransferase